jgi:hypothetical protein
LPEREKLEILTAKKNHRKIQKIEGREDSAAINKAQHG